MKINIKHVNTPVFLWFCFHVSQHSQGVLKVITYFHQIQLYLTFIYIYDNTLKQMSLIDFMYISMNTNRTLIN